MGTRVVPDWGDLKMSRSRRSPAAVTVTVLVSIAGMVLVVAAAHLVASFGDLAPAGETCYFEDDPGSGPSGTGREEVEWGLFPERVCIEDRPPGIAHVYRGAAVDGNDWIVLLSYPAALVLAPLIGVAAGSLVDRRRLRAGAHRSVDVTSDE